MIIVITMKTNYFWNWNIFFSTKFYRSINPINTKYSKISPFSIALIHSLINRFPYDEVNESWNENNIPKSKHIEPYSNTQWKTIIHWSFISIFSRLYMSNLDDYFSETFHSHFLVFSNNQFSFFCIRIVNFSQCYLSAPSMIDHFPEYLEMSLIAIDIH